MSETSWWAGSRAVLPAHFFALLLWHASAQESAPATRPATVLEGRVLRADGTPVPQARILVARLRHDTLPPPVGSCVEGRNEPLLEFTRSDPEGRFRVAALAGVSYLLGAQAADAMSAPLWPALAGDPIELRMRPVRRITGSVRLTDPGVEPRPGVGARVTALLGLAERDPILGSQPRCPVQATAGRDGTFALEVPQDLPFTLDAELPGRERARWAAAEIGAGAVCLDLPPARRVAGTVRAAGTEQPLAGTRVQCLSSGGEQLGTWTDAAGRFELTPQFAPDRVLAFPANHLAYGVGVGADQPLDLLLDAPVLAITARLLRTNGSPLGAARMILIGLVPRPAHSPTYTEWPAQVGPDGKIRIGCARAGLPLLGLVEVDGQWLQFLAAMPTGSVDLGELRLSTAGSLAGRVSLANGAPAAHAAVILQPHRPTEFDGEPAGASPLGRVLDRVVHTDHAGRFVAEHLQPGAYRVAAKTVSHGYRVVDATVGPTTPPLAITLPDAPMLAGTVFDGRRKPVPGARVVLGRKATPGLMTGTHHFVLITDGRGRFQLPGPAEESDTRWQVEVTATQDGQRSHAYQGDVPVGTLNLELVLVPDQAK